MNEMTYAKYIRKGIALILFALCFPLIASAKGETVDAMSVHITLSPNGSALVQEEIIYDFGDISNEHHGIIRRIPLIFSVNGSLKQRSVEISSIMITDGEGKLLESTYTGGGNYIELKIGDKNTVVRGLKRYVIRYTLWGAVDQERYRDRDLFVWDTTGTEWNVPVRSARADIVLPIPIQEKKISTECFQGVTGSTNLCDTVMTPQEGTGIVNSVRFVSHGPLLERESMKISVGIPKGYYIIAPRTHEKQLAKSVFIYHWWRTPYLDGSIVVPIFLAGLMVYLWWRRRGRDLIAKISYPCVVAESFFSPLEIGYAQEGEIGVRVLVALLIDLALKKNITITPIIKKKKLIDFQIVPESPSILFEGAPVGENNDAKIFASTLVIDDARIVSTLDQSLSHIENGDQKRSSNWSYCFTALLLIGSSFLLSFWNLALLLTGILVLLHFFYDRMHRRFQFTQKNFLIDEFKQSILEGGPESDMSLFPYRILFCETYDDLNEYISNDVASVLQTALWYTHAHPYSNKQFISDLQLLDMLLSNKPEEEMEKEK